MKILVLALDAFLTQFALATSASDVKNKAGETADAAAQYTKEQKDAFVKEMQKNIDDLNAKIKDMKAQAGKSKDENLAKLEEKKKNMEHDLAALKNSSGKAWDKLKAGMSKAWDDIKSSMNDAGQEMKK